MTTFASRAHSHAAPAPRAALTIEWVLAHGGDALLAITVDGASAFATLSTGGAAPVPVASGTVHTQAVENLDHTDAPGILSLTTRRNPDGTREILFARTPLLETLGVRGGCVERPRLAMT